MKLFNGSAKETLNATFDSNKVSVLGYKEIACGYLTIEYVWMLGHYAVCEIHEQGNVTVHKIFDDRMSAIKYANQLLADEEEVSDILHDRFMI